DRAQRLAQHRFERWMLVGNLVGGVLAESLTAFDVRVDRPTLDRSGTDDRHLDRYVLEVGWARAAQRLHLCPALDLEDPGRIGVLDALVGLRVVVGDAGQIDLLATRPGD